MVVASSYTKLPKKRAENESQNAAEGRPDQKKLLWRSVALEWDLLQKAFRRNSFQNVGTEVLTCSGGCGR